VCGPAAVSGRTPRSRVDPILSESRQELHILLVEDDPGDVLMTQEAFEHHKITNPLHVVTDGVAAMEFLRGRGRYADAPRPGLILLDLNLPKMDGREVLAEIKSDDNLRSIPVVVLTTSSAEEDILRSYNTYANAYVTKPVDLLRFMDVVRQIEDFFITVVQHPR
jgi:CheY-like chemotaxis protein